MKPLDGGVAALSAPDAAPELRLVAFQDRPGTASRRGRSARLTSCSRFTLISFASR
jgi:hypothetical protein